MRHFANVALKEKEATINRCPANQSKAKIVPETTTTITNTTTRARTKKYVDIPGPKGLFGIGTIYHYFPVFGMQILFNENFICFFFKLNLKTHLNVE